MSWQLERKWIGAAALVLFVACSGEPSQADDAGTDAGADAGTDAGDPGFGGDGGLAVQYGGANLDEFIDVVLDEEGVYVAGYRNGVPGTLDPSGDTAGIVRGYSRASGELMWETRYDLEHATEVADALALDADTLLVAGRTSGSYPGFTNAGKADLFVSRLHTGGGTATLVLQAGDERPQHPARIALDGQGEIAVAGMNDLWVDENYVAAWEDTMVARVTWDAEQNQFGLKSFARSKTDVPDAWYGLVAIGEEGDVIVSGSVFSGPAKGVWVRRLASDGTVRWAYRLSPLSYDSGMALAVGPDGYVYLAGSTFLQFGDRSYGQMDAYVIRIDPSNGAFVDGMQAGSDESEWVRDIAVDAQGNVWVAGGTQGALPGFERRGGQDAFVAVFDPSGKWVRSWQHGSGTFDEVAAIALDESSNAYVAGSTEGNFVPGEEYGGRRDGFLVKLAPEAFIEVRGAK